MSFGAEHSYCLRPPAFCGQRRPPVSPPGATVQPRGDAGVFR